MKKRWLWLVGLGGLAAGVWWLRVADVTDDRTGQADERPRRLASALDSAPAEGDVEGCNHPLAPPEGTSLEYLIYGDALSGRIRFDLIGWTRAESGWEGRWRVELVADGQSPLVSELSRACDSDVMEEFWEMSDLVTPLVVVRNRTWRWPARLVAGLRFDGSIDIELGRHRGSVRREHRVRGRAQIDVPAGSFEGWAVDVVDRSGAAETLSEVWVAEGVGMVRMIQHLPEGTVTYELVERRP